MQSSTILSIFACFLLTLSACAPEVTATRGDFEPLPLSLPERFDNPSSPEKLSLGKLLFYDPILSGEKDVACATCHHPRHAFADDRELSLGVGGRGLGPTRQDQSGGSIPPAKRNSPSLINVAYNGLVQGGFLDQAESPMFWDHRAMSLETQAIGPLLSFEEMRGNAYAEADALDSIVARLQNNPEYVALFQKAFPGESSLEATQIAQALAVYQRSLVAPNSRFDRYLRGETSALTPDEITGLDQFIARGCAECHSGPMLSDYELHRLGVADHPGLRDSDRGNGQDQFKTPTLRNVTRTAPYMHNGTQATLEDVIQFYNDQ